MQASVGHRVDDPVESALVEGTARVVAVKGDVAWLEPEQTTSCGTCHSAAACGVKSGHGRLTMRRFELANDAGLKVGERVVVGIHERTLLRATIIAYGLPLVFMLAAGITANATIGTDAAAAIAAVCGLGVGLLIAILRANRLSSRGELSPRYLGRAFGPGPGADCNTDCG